MILLISIINRGIMQKNGKTLHLRFFQKYLAKSIVYQFSSIIFNVFVQKTQFSLIILYKKHDPKPISNRCISITFLTFKLNRFQCGLQRIV